MPYYKNPIHWTIQPNKLYPSNFSRVWSTVLQRFCLVFVTAMEMINVNPLKINALNLHIKWLLYFRYLYQLFNLYAYTLFHYFPIGILDYQNVEFHLSFGCKGLQLCQVMGMQQVQRCFLNHIPRRCTTVECRHNQALFTVPCYTYTYLFLSPITKNYNSLRMCFVLAVLPLRRNLNGVMYAP